MNSRQFQDAPLLVLTATLGRSPWLDAAVRSVVCEAGGWAAHVLVAPPAAVADLQARYPHCEVVAERGNPAGLYAALNDGWSAAETWRWRWMTFLADDDLFLAGFRAFYSTADQQTSGGEMRVWHGEVELIDAAGRRLCRVPYARSSRDIAALVTAGYSPFNQQGMLYSRAAAEMAGWFDVKMRVCGDAAHWLRALENGASFHHVRRVIAAFRIHSGQISADVDLHVHEFAGLRARARKIHGARRLWPAVVRFRLLNTFLYLERIWRVGFKSGFQLLRSV